MPGVAKTREQTYFIAPFCFCPREPRCRLTMKGWDRRELPPGGGDIVSSHASCVHACQAPGWGLYVCMAMVRVQRPRGTKTEPSLPFFFPTWTKLLFWAPSLVNGRNWTSGPLGTTLPQGYFLSSGDLSGPGGIVGPEEGMGIWYQVCCHLSTCWLPGYPGSHPMVPVGLSWVLLPLDGRASSDGLVSYILTALAPETFCSSWATWEQRMLGGGLWPFCPDLRQFLLWNDFLRRWGGPQVPFALRSRNLSGTYHPPFSPTPHGDLGCWAGWTLFLRKAPSLLTQCFSEVFSSAWRTGRFALSQQCFPQVDTYVLAFLGSRLFSLSLHSYLVSFPYCSESLGD